ncbi:hypothetical protein J6590_078370 [Homalodisca vitripennis]|nr:hypothetical protein J6590_078370 [Homalodisca vitripennis]
MFAESDLVETLDRVEGHEHDREISELLDRMNEPQEVWDETSLDRRLFRGLPFGVGHCLRTVTMTAMTPFPCLKRRRSMEVAVCPHHSVALSPTPPTRPPSPVPPYNDDNSGLSAFIKSRNTVCLYVLVASVRPLNTGAPTNPTFGTQ